MGNIVGDWLCPLGGATGFYSLPCCFHNSGLHFLTGERVFPPQYGLTFSSWLCIEKIPQDKADTHPVRLLQIARKLADQSETLLCLTAMLDWRDHALLVSTQETLMPKGGEKSIGNLFSNFTCQCASRGKIECVLQWTIYARDQSSFVFWMVLFTPVKRVRAFIVPSWKGAWYAVIISIQNCGTACWISMDVEPI